MHTEVEWDPEQDQEYWIFLGLQFRIEAETSVEFSIKDIYFMTSDFVYKCYSVR